MDFIVGVIKLILIIAGSHFTEGKACNSNCGDLEDNKITSCVITKSKCDIMFPELRIFDDNFRFSWVEINFHPHDNMGGTRPNPFEFQSTLRFRGNHTIHRFSVFISNTARRDVLNTQTQQRGVSVYFSISEVIAQDLGVYEISLVGLDNITDKGTYIINHSYYLFMESKFLLAPKCDLVNSSITDHLPMFVCSLFGYFLPHVILTISMHPADENCTIFQNQKKVPGISLVRANVTSCRSSAVICLANQTMGTPNSDITISRACVFDPIHSSSSPPVSLSASSFGFVLNLTNIQSILILVIVPTAIIAANIICWRLLLMDARKRNVQQVDSESVDQMQEEETRESTSIGNEKSASSFDAHCATSAEVELYENNVDPFTKGPCDSVYDDI